MKTALRITIYLLYALCLTCWMLAMMNNYTGFSKAISAAATVLCIVYIVGLELYYDKLFAPKNK